MIRKCWESKLFYLSNQHWNESLFNYSIYIGFCYCVIIIFALLLLMGVIIWFIIYLFIILVLYVGVFIIVIIVIYGPILLFLLCCYGYFCVIIVLLSLTYNSSLKCLYCEKFLKIYKKKVDWPSWLVVSTRKVD